MGHFDRKNWIVQVETKDNLSDNEILAYLQGKDQQLTLKEFWNYRKKHLKSTFYNSKAESIVRFFTCYDEGKMMPDRYNSFEPINKQFSLDKIPDIINSLCWPGGSIYLKKLRQYEVSIENNEFAIVFEDGKYLPPIATPPEYMTTIRMCFDKKRNKDPMVFIKLLHDLCGYLGTNRGFIKDQEDGNIIYKVAAK